MLDEIQVILISQGLEAGDFAWKAGEWLKKNIC